MQIQWCVVGLAGNFYKYIYRVHNGWQIKKDGETFGWYEDIRDALFDRDRLVNCNWDIEEFVWLPETENPYLNIRLPHYSLNRWRQYIYPNKKSFRVCKRIDGELKCFGTYKTLDEAMDKRDELIEKGWCL